MYLYRRLRGIIIRDWKGRGALPPVPVMTIRSYYRIRGSTTRYIYTYYMYMYKYIYMASNCVIVSTC